MLRIISLMATFIIVLMVNAETFSYKFYSMPLSQAIRKIAEEHPNLEINFIYNELENYITNSSVKTDNPYDALRQTIGFNPVTVIKSKNTFFVEALQHGKFRYSGKVVGTDSKPVAGATVMLLTPKDSTVITYGIVDEAGRFSIPCDRRGVIGKLSCIGYKTLTTRFETFTIGTILMEEQALTLGPVTVESDNAHIYSDKSVYIPTSRQKNASQNAVELLRYMALPQLNLSPGSDEIKDVFGNSVVVFINYLPADKNELHGMNISDVKRIEYLDYPPDPRFRGEAHVLNFIVQEYKYGGYTKASMSETSLNGFSNNSSLYSKFTYKGMTYDLFMGAENSDFHNVGTDTKSKFSIIRDNIPVIVRRSETNESAQRKTNEYPLTFRASYNTNSFTLRNTVSFTHSSTPYDDMSGMLNIDLFPEMDYSFKRKSSKRLKSLMYRGDLWNLFSDKISLDVIPSFYYTYRNNNSHYESTYSYPIEYNIIENVYTGNVQANLRIMFNKSHSLILGLSGQANQHTLKYTGSRNFNDDYLNVSISENAGYNLRANKFSFYGSIGLCENFHSVNTIKSRELLPTCTVSGRIMPNKNSQISASLYYYIFMPAINLRANDIIQNNEFMYLTGNPNLKSHNQIQANMAYNWFKDNTFNLALFSGFDENFNRVASIYEPYDDGRAILRNFINNGNYIRGYLGAQFNYKLFDNHLQFYCNLAENIFHTTGIYNTTVYSFRLQLQAAYYWKSFNIIVSWVNPSKRLTENSNVIISDRNYHTLSIGWGNGTWNIRIRGANLFNKGWKSNTWESHAKLYSELRNILGPWAHPSINISAIYTLGYGKKVQRDNEIGKQASGGSAIIE